MALKLPTLNFGNRKKSGSEDSPIATTIMESAPPPRRAAPEAAPQARSVKGRSAAEKIGVLGFVFALATVVGLGLLFYQYRQAGHSTALVAASGEMETLAQRISKSAQLALQGNAASFAELRDGSRRFNTLIDTLANGGSIDGQAVNAAPSGAQATVQELAALWQKTSERANQLIAQEKNLLALNSAVAAINAQDAELVEHAEHLVQFKQQTGPVRDVALAAGALALTQRIAKNANALLVADTIDPQTAFALGKDTRTLTEQLAELRGTTADPEARRRLQALEAGAARTQEAVTGILDNIQALVGAKAAGRAIFNDSDSLSELTHTLSSALSRSSDGLSPASVGIGLAAVIGLLALSMMAKINNRELAARQQEAEGQQRNAENERNQAQQAILRLMNEMGDLADGDLTVRTTVSEDITGAIADSVNYTIEELSVLVRRINDAATRVTQATEAAQKISTELLGATERQSQSITDAGSTIQQMAKSMTDSSERALRSAQVARRSLESARNGANAVENTIKGMNGIREQIQETSKRIKRLGESSQEIGEIVELISDITEQTNVLALNAAIQAASAGEAGRGFTVVAEEVQRLAERSAEATKQIAAIVKTIQTDTKDAVASMENATRDVVEGAQLSDAAGQALADIGEVSTETARLIEQISSDTQHQAATATRVAEGMKEILAITEQTAHGTRQTAVSIGQLADLAVELKGSVSGFKV